MATAWTVIGIIVALVVAGGIYGFGRGLWQAAREGVRRDLIVLGQAREVAGMLAQLGGGPACSFAPPLTRDRTHPFGWLWWRAQVGPTGDLQRDMGWALTYRRARRAAGAPVRARSPEVEFVVAPRGSAPQPVADGSAADSE